jgi:hypothetical protein
MLVTDGQPETALGENFPMAFDAAQTPSRWFFANRLGSSSSISAPASRQHAKSCDDADDVFFDAKRRCGAVPEGTIPNPAPETPTAPQGRQSPRHLPYAR